MQLVAAFFSEYGNENHSVVEKGGLIDIEINQICDEILKDYIIFDTYSKYKELKELVDTNEISVKSNYKYYNDTFRHNCYGGIFQTTEEVISTEPNKYIVVGKALEKLSNK